MGQPIKQQVCGFETKGRNARRCVLPFGHEGFHDDVLPLTLEQDIATRNLLENDPNIRATLKQVTTKRESKMTVQDLALIREAILMVIDDGWRCNASCDIAHPWKFDSKDTVGDEAEENERRLKFADAIQAYITDRIIREEE